MSEHPYKKYIVSPNCKLFTKAIGYVKPARKYRGQVLINYATKDNSDFIRARASDGNVITLPKCYILSDEEARDKHPELLI